MKSTDSNSVWADIQRAAAEIEELKRKWGWKGRVHKLTINEDAYMALKILRLATGGIVGPETALRSITGLMSAIQFSVVRDQVEPIRYWDWEGNEIIPDDEISRNIDIKPVPVLFPPLPLSNASFNNEMKISEE